MPNDYSKYFFVPGSSSPVILNLKKLLNSLSYIKAKNTTNLVFDPQMKNFAR